MQTNNHQINDYDAVLDAKFGKPGTPERHVAEAEAARLYYGKHRSNYGEHRRKNGNGRSIYGEHSRRHEIRL